MMATRPVEGKYQPHHDLAYMGKIEPMSDQGCRQQDSLIRNAATLGSWNLRRALLRYGAKYGLPNLSGLQCIGELDTLVMVRAEELALAAKITVELQRHNPLPGIEFE